MQECSWPRSSSKAIALPISLCTAPAGFSSATSLSSYSSRGRFCTTQNRTCFSSGVPCAGGQKPLVKICSLVPRRWHLVLRLVDSLETCVTFHAVRGKKKSPQKVEQQQLDFFTLYQLGRIKNTGEKKFSHREGHHRWLRC